VVCFIDAQRVHAAVVARSAWREAHARYLQSEMHPALHSRTSTALAEFRRAYWRLTLTERKAFDRIIHEVKS
jgi:predicted dithiol-disulfide oxidoreductase (DUF899 family)